MKIKITKKVYEEIKNTVGKKIPETGGMLGLDNNGIISHYVFDKNAVVGGAEYNPNVNFLQKIIDQWMDNNIKLIGFVHSHPNTFMQPSYADLDYAKEIIDIFSLDFLFLPIIKSSYSATFEIYPYVIKLDKKGKPYEELVQLFIGENKYEIGTDLEEQIEYITEETTSEKSTLTEEEIIANFIKMGEDKIIYKNKPVVKKELSSLEEEYESETIYEKIKNTIDIKRINSSLIIGVGCGGARDFYIDMARSGVKSFILVDGDIYEEKNIGVQGAYISDIGKYKVDAIKEELLNINKDINVTAINEFLREELDDLWFENLLKNHNKKNILLCAFTDQFEAQARLENLSIKYQLKYLSAQHYENSIGSEVIYYYPKISKTLPKCFLKDRYEAYLEEGFINDVTSEGSLISYTTRINALCGKIAIGMLNYSQKNKNNMVSSFLVEIPERNLIIIRNNRYLDYILNMENHFPNLDSTYNDDVIWLSYEDLYSDTNCEDIIKEEVEGEK